MITYTLLPACSPKSTFIWNKWMHLTYFNLSVLIGCYQMFVHKSFDNLTLFDSKYLSIKIIINQSSICKKIDKKLLLFDRWVRNKKRYWVYNPPYTWFAAEYADAEEPSNKIYWTKDCIFRIREPVILTNWHRICSLAPALCPRDLPVA